MQTFLPYTNYTLSAACLDSKRLGKQRVECMQIHKALCRSNSHSEIISNSISKAWINHPATLMWKDYIPQLVEYSQAMMYQWEVVRGYSNLLCWMYFSRQEHYIHSYNEDRLNASGDYPPVPKHELPHWLTEEFILSHRSNLLRKNPEHYGVYFPNVPNDLPYIWPVSKM